MTKDVLVSIHGTQKADNMPSEELKLVTPGKYYNKNGKHYVLYEEFTQEDNRMIRNTLQFGTDFLSITKRGAVDSCMVIEPKKSNITQYQTQFGMLQISIDGKNVTIEEKDSFIRVLATYDMNINFENVGENHVMIDITAKEGGGFSLTQ